MKPALLLLRVPLGFDAEIIHTEAGTDLRVSASVPIFGVRTVRGGKPLTHAQWQRRADAIVRDLRKLERVMLDAAERHSEGA